VRSVRGEVSRWDPAGFHPEHKRGKLPEHYFDEYVTPSLKVSEALLDGATRDEAILVFRREMTRLYPDRPLSPQAMRRLARDWAYYEKLPWWAWLRRPQERRMDLDDANAPGGPN
jgi:hypothetical protein